MRVVIAPDKFAGTLTAVEAAHAVAEGWRSVEPDAGLDLCPLSDGGPGFVDVLAEARPGRLLTLTVTGPLGAPAEGRILRTGDAGDAGDIAYVESAQACGLHLIPPADRDPERATTYGVGELIAAAIADGARRIVVGLGGSATTDGGAGMLAALGATAVSGQAVPAAGSVGAAGIPARTDPLSGGGGALAEIGAVDLAAALRTVDGIELIAASDVDNPLCGLTGAAAIFGPQKGADRARVLALDDALAGFARRVAASLPESATTETPPTEAGAPDQPAAGLADRPGAGAAGGLGFAIYALGGRFASGIGSVVEAVRLDSRTESADLVITGEGAFDHQSLRGKVPHGVARAAAAHGVPCVVLAGRVAVGRREMAAANITEAYALVDPPGSEQAAFADPYGELVRMAARVARIWTRGR